MQKELREVDRLSCFKGNVGESHCSISCKRWRKGGMISCLSTRRRKKVAEDTKPPGQKKKFAERSTAAKEEMRSIREEIDWKEERFRLLSDKVDINRLADAEMEAELQGLIEVVAMQRKRFIAAWRRWWSRFLRQSPQVSRKFSRSEFP